MEKIAVLGATGSIGQSTLDLIAMHPQRYCATVLTANRQSEKMFDLCEQFRPQLVVMADAHAAKTLHDRLAGHSWGRTIDVHHGEDSLADGVIGSHVDTVVAGIVGAAGLGSAIAAARHGKKILLANKEALVMAGALMVAAAAQGGATVLPIDSEHNAIFQCLGPGYRCFVRPKGVQRLLLTASGGPFRTWELQRIMQATVGQAIAHPNWSMGKKISVDSATMMNKGLELIEAHWLFAMPESHIDVVIHPQSVVHSMVEFDDASTLAQLGSPDMRTPIACAMSWPERIITPVTRLDWTSLRQLDFELPDDARFPSLSLARQTLRTGGCASAILNAANEIAVAEFLQERLRFGHIFEVVKATLESMSANLGRTPESLEALFDLDARARISAQSHCKRISA